MPGQWEFQVGPVGPLELGDEVMLARWLLHRLGEDFGISSTFDPKPVKGDWNGTGAHTNYSTESMRNPGGMDVSGERGVCVVSLMSPGIIVCWALCLNWCALSGCQLLGQVPCARQHNVVGISVLAVAAAW